MSMPFSMEWKLITSGMEKRLTTNKNLFEIQFSGYRLFPINEVVEVQRFSDSCQIGNGKIVELTWKDNVTVCKYQLLSLQNVN